MYKQPPISVTNQPRLNKYITWRQSNLWTTKKCLKTGYLFNCRPPHVLARWRAATEEWMQEMDWSVPSCRNAKTSNNFSRVNLCCIDRIKSSETKAKHGRRLPKRKVASFCFSHWEKLEGKQWLIKVHCRPRLWLNWAK